MIFCKPSPTIRTYLVSILAAQSVTLKAERLKGVFSREGNQISPLPPGIPLLQSDRKPRPPVTGLLPICDGPLNLAAQLIKERESIDGGWAIWPVESSVWLTRLAEVLAENLKGSSDSRPNNPILPTLKGIPLARLDEGKEPSNLQSPEVNTIIESPPGWRTLTLICWDIEYMKGRSWYISVAWQTLWQRRLKRAPEITNLDKIPKLD